MRSALSYDAVWRRPQGVLVTSPPCRARPALRAATQLVGRSSRVRWVDTGGAQRGLGSTREDERPDRTGSTRPAVPPFHFCVGPLENIYFSAVLGGKNGRSRRQIVPTAKFKPV
jgi:hypothetical protein